MIEQGGTSLYPSLAQRVTDPEVLRILLSIGPTETMHFQTWQDKAGNTPPLTDPTNELVFPDLKNPAFGGEDFQINLIMPGMRSVRMSNGLARWETDGDCPEDGLRN